MTEQTNEVAAPVVEEKKSLMDTILETAKEEGLDAAEEVIAKVAKVAFKGGQKWMLNHDNTMVRIMSAVLPAIEPEVMAEIDKIDGEDDEGR